MPSRRAGKIDIGGDGSAALGLGGNGQIYGKIAAKGFEAKMERPGEALSESG